MSIERRPRQSDWVGRRVRVVFDYDTSRETAGVIVRDDVEEPGRLIIRLDDDFHVLATECQWTFAKVA